jgi:hypothetical protein
MSKRKARLFGYVRTTAELGPVRKPVFLSKDRGASTIFSGSPRANCSLRHFFPATSLSWFPDVESNPKNDADRRETHTSLAPALARNFVKFFTNSEALMAPIRSRVVACLKMRFFFSRPTPESILLKT